MHDTWFCWTKPSSHCATTQVGLSAEPPHIAVAFGSFPAQSLPQVPQCSSVVNAPPS
jgi:hypothetical protein